MEDKKETSHTMQLWQAIQGEDLKKLDSVLKEHPHLVNCKHKFEGNQDECTPLMSACPSGSCEIVRLLIEHGADISATDSKYIKGEHSTAYWGFDGGYGCSDGIFPLFYATKSKNLPVVKELLSAGASVNQTNAIGQSALHRACINHDTALQAVAIVEILVEFGADVNLQDKNGWTPLHYVCNSICGSIKMAEILHDNGANISVQNNYGISPLEQAAQCNYKLTMFLIEKCNLTKREIIEAYETIASSYTCPKQFECLYKATEMRKEYNVPKKIMEPMECYGFPKEWETVDGLWQYKDNPVERMVQGFLAKERIFYGRYLNLMNLELLPELRIGGKNRTDECNELLKHYLEIFRNNNDYLYIGDILNDSPVIEDLLEDLCYGYVEYKIIWIEGDILHVLFKVIMDSWLKIQEALKTETKPASIRELFDQYESIFRKLTGIILHMFRRMEESRDAENEDKKLLESVVKEMLRHLPVVTSPFSDYKAPLAHNLFRNNDEIDEEALKEYYYDLMELLINSGLDLDITDSKGYTLLHQVVSHIPHSPETTEKLVGLLLESGINIHARNKYRHTALDMLDYADNEPMTDVIKLLTDYEKLKSLKCIAAISLGGSKLNYKNYLPEDLIKFVDMH